LILTSLLLPLLYLQLLLLDENPRNPTRLVLRIEEHLPQLPCKFGGLGVAEESGEVELRPPWIDGSVAVVVFVVVVEGGRVEIVGFGAGEEEVDGHVRDDLVFES